jgi:RRXRR protein
MSKVFVLDTNKQPLNAAHAGRARLLLKQGKAAVYRRYPFTLILKRELEQPHLKPLRVKVDPGSKTSGIALVNDASGEVVWAAELIHRGEQIKRNMDKRRAVRKNRRQRDAAAVNATRWALFERVKGFQTGDLVRAVVTSGTKPGICVGKVAVRTRGVFNIQTAQGTVTDIQYRFCKVVARSDGYNYHSRKEAALPPAA